ncbi:M13 family metallopeptidase [Nannocystaceae bacterium ST9]
MSVSLRRVCLPLALVACHPPPSTGEQPEPGGSIDPGKLDDEPKPKPPTTGVAGLLASIDPQADPCVDFHRYACGGWLDATERPADQPFYGRSFDQVSDANEQVLHELLDELAAQALQPIEGQRDPIVAQLGGYYAACMDLDARDQAGLAPLAPTLAGIEGIADREQFMTVLGELHRTIWGRVGWLGSPAAPPFFIALVESDYMQAPDKNMLTLSQAGLGLPSRAMYLPPEGPEGEAGRALLERYRRHVAAVFEAAGVPAEQAAADAAVVLAIETELAAASLTPVELRDDEANYHKLGFKGLGKLGKRVAWKAYFAAAELPQTRRLVVRTPKFFTAAAALIDARELAELRTYLKWSVLHAAAPHLDRRFITLDFQLTQLVTGVEQAPPQWKVCANEAMWALPDRIGPRYVERAFPGESKAIADDMIDRINAAMNAGFPSLAWMDDATREKAAEKIAKMDRKIGYPDRWRDYADVAIDPGRHFANVLAEKQANAAREAGKIDQPIDRSEWLMPAPLVNAYNNPATNEIAFPAGILQPPFFAADQPMVMNFGGIGAIAGHELTHGFDDEGRKRDASGKLTQWWSEPVAAAFEQRVACVEQQYSRYEALPGKFVDGELTAGENIADIGGVKEAYFAYQTWVAEAPERGEPVAEGLTNDQVFFVAWAQNWCAHATEAHTLRQLEMDPHSPAKFRAIGPLANLPAFAEAFACAEGTPMNPVDRCEVW